MKECIFHLTKEDRKDICDLMIACTYAEFSCVNVEKWHKLHDKLSCFLTIFDTLTSDNN